MNGTTGTAFPTQDLTELEQSGESLRRSEARYRRLFETAQDGILILDAETGQVIDANPFMRVLLGYSLEDVLGIRNGDHPHGRIPIINQFYSQLLRTFSIIRSASSASLL